MKRNLYYVTSTRHSLNSSGIEYKISKQIEIFQRSGFEVKEVPNFVGQSFIKKLSNYLPFFSSRYDYRSLSNIQGVDCIYIRYYLCSSELIRALTNIRKRNPNVVIFIEIPTYPYDDEFSGISFRSKILLMKDKISRNQLSKLVDRIVTFSDDMSIFNIPTVRISNGVDIEKVQSRKIFHNSSGEIHLIAVAQFSYWHGYDRLIDGLHEYMQNGGNQKFYIHIVGDGVKKIIAQYKAKVEKYDLQKFVIFHGKKMGEELDRIYDQCDLAVDSLGRHRSGVFFNSSLKGKEYLAKGLPIISGVKTELDNATDFPFYYRVPADDTPVNFEEIEKFYHSIYDNADPDLICKFIRQYCETHFSIEKAFRPVIEEFNALCQKKNDSL